MDSRFNPGDESITRMTRNEVSTVQQELFQDIAMVFYLPVVLLWVIVLRCYHGVLSLLAT